MQELENAVTPTAWSVLIVDDDAEIRNLVQEYLSDEGISVEEACDGESMRACIAESVPDLVLLDLKLPGEDGLSLARELRQNHQKLGVIMISGKEDVVDRVAGLEVGADDYLVKPFHLRELLARVRSVLRRSDNFGSVNAAPAGDLKKAIGRAAAEPRTIYTFSNWLLDKEGRTLESAHGEPIELTGGEFDLLVAFVAHPNRALSRDQLLDYARSRETDAFDRSIDVQVGRLRRKIEHDPRRPTLIKTVRNVGYMFSADVKILRYKD